MPQIIATNVASLNAQRNLNANQTNLSTALQRLSSGLRINSSRDDAAGLAISERMTSQIRGLNQAVRNANDAISLSQTAEGSLAEIGNVLQRMRELAVQSANDTNTAADRGSLQTEATQLSSEIDRIAQSAQFNGKNLLDGSFGNATFQVGANAGQSIVVSIGNAKGSALGIGGAATVVGSATSTTASGSTGGLTINGTTISASTDDGVSYVGGSQAGTTSALSLANAINAQSTTGVSASAVTQVTSAAVSTLNALASGDVTLNGVNLGAISVAATAADRVNQLVQAINNKSGTTGVTAVAAAGNKYTLTAADGRNIDLVGAASITANTDVGFTIKGTTLTNYGQVSLTSGKAITLGGSTDGGLANGTYALVGNAVDVTSQTTANAAITSIDNALSIVNTQRAMLGSIQSRFDSVIANLQTSSENLNGARSRIRDADFAAETAALTRGQILQQAGTAMLAQANSLPNSVLSLLK
jgi:flagellin